MLEICLLALSWMADPAAIERSGPNALTPLATCARPAVLVTEANTVCALTPARQADSPAITTWLRRWERATRNAPERSRSEREEFRRQIHEEFNEHALAAVEQVVGQVKADQLNELFEWRIVERTRDRVCLEATPRDEMERLFYRSLRISLEADTAIPEQLVIVNRNQLRRTVWQADQDSANPIELVHFENDVPPAPKVLLKTANAQVD